MTVNLDCPQLNAVQLGELLDSRKGAKIVTIQARTDISGEIKGGKSSGFWNAHEAFRHSLVSSVEKVAIVNGIVNWSYERAVNRQREREGTPTNEADEILLFEANPRRWGQRVHKSAFVRHIPKGTDEKRVYLEYKVQKSIGHKYYIEGVAVPDTWVEPWLRPKSESSRQQVEDKIILRDYRLSSIEYLTIGGQIFQIEVSAEDETALYDSLG